MNTIQPNLQPASTPIIDKLMMIKALKKGVDFNPVFERAVENRQQELQREVDPLKDRLLNKAAQKNEDNLEIVRDIAETDIFEDANIKKGKIQEALGDLKPVVTELEEKVEVSTRELSETSRNTALLINQLKTFKRELNKGNDNSFEEPLGKIGNQLCHYINKEGKNL